MARVEISPAGDRYRAGNLVIRHATTADDAALRQILRDNPMQGWLRLTLERSPSYFAGEHLMGRSRVIIGEDAARDGKVIGMYHVAFQPLLVNGKAMQAGYLGELRINPAYRHSLRLLKQGFASIRPLTRPDSAKAEIWFTSIASDNRTARRLLESGNPHLPRYRPAGELQTLAISVRHGKRPALLRQATKADIPGICDFYNRQARRYHFATLLTPGWLDEESKLKGLGIGDFRLLKDAGEIQACIAIWDQRTFKQVVAQGYRFPLGPLRPAYNLYARLLGRPLLPKPGRRLESIYLAFFALAPSVESLATEVIREALFIAGTKHARIGLIGLAQNHPLLGRIRSCLRPTVYQTCIETVTWEDTPPPELDERAIQPEIAIL
jgi:N-acetylglutamate synthase-like GNAT family acetyltransferase